MPDGIPLPDWPRGMPAPMAAHYVGLSESTLRNEMNAGRFPKAVRVSVARVVWLKEDLDAWLDEKAGRSKGSHGRTPDSDPSAVWDLEFSDTHAA
jgi:predicted DNA-binding transcriptional regulator AlpA